MTGFWGQALCWCSALKWRGRASFFSLFLGLSPSLPLSLFPFLPFLCSSSNPSIFVPLLPFLFHHLYCMNNILSSGGDVNSCLLTPDRADIQEKQGYHQTPYRNVGQGSLNRNGNGSNTAVSPKLGKDGDWWKLPVGSSAGGQLSLPDALSCLNLFWAVELVWEWSPVVLTVCAWGGQSLEHLVCFRDFLLLSRA